MSDSSGINTNDPTRTTLAELAATLGISKKSASLRANREAWPYETVPHPGRLLRQYPLSSLPENVRDAVVMWRANNDARTVKTEEYAPSSPDNTKPMPDKAKAIGLAKLELHGAWRRQRRNARPKSAADAAFLTAYNAGQSHPAIFQLVGKISKGSLYRWDKQLKEAAAITMSFVIIAAGPRTRVGKGGSAPKRRKSC